jgi:hypothetical protein
MGQTRWETNLSTARLPRMSQVSRGRIYGAGGFFQYLVRERNDSS